MKKNKALHTFFKNTWQEIRKKPFTALILASLVVLAIFICFYHLGSSYFENWDEGFYAEVTKQILKSGNWIVLRWNGDIFLDKPPLNFWFDAVAAGIFGLSEFSIRLTSALSGFAVIVIVLFYAYRKWGLVPALLAYSAVALNNIFVWRARTGNIDALATLLILLIFLVIVSKHRLRLLFLGVLFDLIFLQKASLGLYPLVIFVIYEFVYNRTNIIPHIRDYILCFLIMITLPSLWLILGTHETGSLFYQYFLFSSDQGQGHISLSNIKLDYLSFAYYSLQRRFFYIFIVGLVFLLVKIKDRFNLLLFMFATFLLIELSLSKWSNDWYIMPAIPFWGLTIAYTVNQIMKMAKHMIHPIIMIAIILIPTFYVSYKTFSVNIMSVINTRANVSEVQSALKIKALSKYSDRIMRLDHSHPVTIYYSDRKTYYYDHNDEALYRIIKDQNIRWVVGKRDIVDTFVKNNSTLRLKRIELNDESILQVI